MQQQNTYEGLIESVLRTQAVVQFSLDGLIVDANDIFLKTMGYELKEVVGKHHRIFMESKASDGPEYLQFWANLREGIKQQGEFRRLTKSGEHVWLSATYTPILIDGKATKVIKLAHDVTKEKKRTMDLEAQIEAIRQTQVAQKLLFI